MLQEHGYQCREMEIFLSGSHPITIIIIKQRKKFSLEEITKVQMIVSFSIIVYC